MHRASSAAVAPVVTTSSTMAMRRKRARRRDAVKASRTLSWRAADALSSGLDRRVPRASHPEGFCRDSSSRRQYSRDLQALVETTHAEAANVQGNWKDALQAVRFRFPGNALREQASQGRRDRQIPLVFEPLDQGVQGIRVAKCGYCVAKRWRCVDALSAHFRIGDRQRQRASPAECVDSRQGTNTTCTQIVWLLRSVAAQQAYAGQQKRQKILHRDPPWSHEDAPSMIAPGTDFHKSPTRPQSRWRGVPAGSGAVGDGSPCLFGVHDMVVQ